MALLPKAGLSIHCISDAEVFSSYKENLERMPSFITESHIVLNTRNNEQNPLRSNAERYGSKTH